MFYPALFLAGAALNILLGLRGWPALLAGNLSDPDSYMRLVRLAASVHAGHLLLVVPRDDSGAGVLVEWSRLFDAFIWALAAPLAPFWGWHRALFVAGAMLSPLGTGALGALTAWGLEPFVPRRLLWSAVAAAAVLPGFLTFAAPGVITYHLFLLVLILLTAALAARAWAGDYFVGFLAGLSGGLAIWLTPETMPFILMVFGALGLRALALPMGAVLAACAAGFFDILGFGLAVDPPFGGYQVPEIDRLSLVYVVLALLLLAAAALFWRLEARLPRAAKLLLLAAPVLVWVAVFPKVALGPYGLMSPAQMHAFFGVMLELQPVRGADDIRAFLLPGGLAVVYAVWRAVSGRARWLWAYIALCALVSLILAAKFILFVGFPACFAAAMLPLALAEASLHFDAVPSRAMLARLLLIVLVLVLPGSNLFQASPKAVAPQKTYPNCALHDIAPLLAPAAGTIVLAPVEDTPELLYRTRVETVGSLYQHGVPAYLAARAAWRAAPGHAEPAAVAATGARYVLFCPQAARYALVAAVPPDTLWDALADGNIPTWLSPAGQDHAGWRLYRIKP